MIPKLFILNTYHKQEKQFERIRWQAETLLYGRQLVKWLEFRGRLFFFLTSKCPGNDTIYFWKYSSNQFSSAALSNQFSSAALSNQFSSAALSNQFSSAALSNQFSSAGDQYVSSLAADQIVTKANSRLNDQSLCSSVLRYS